jgi:hypothetical protein
MTALIRFIRRLVIRMQLRSLTRQEQTIIEARNHAQARLMKIRRERGIKEVELWLFYSASSVTTNEAM